MKKLEYQVSFTTPAFLGNAEQNGQWRTPPFKALLRQWWRVVYAAEHDFAVDVVAMRREEGLLFGHAWLENDQDVRGQKVAARKSMVRIRLDCWGVGGETKEKWGQQDLLAQKVSHPEVGNVGPLLYLGYGPLDVHKATKPGQSKPEYLTVLKRNAAIQAGETATFSLALPDKDAPLIERALMLMDHYGTLGGRSRNGWGSFALTPHDGTPALTGTVPLLALSDALKVDWPHAIGKDENPLIWQTKPFDDWKAVMRELAIIKIGLRTQFVFPNTAPPHPQPLPRHWLSYPITRHTTRAFDRNARLPNSLRFKVRPTADGKLIGVVFHVPCCPPAEFHPQLPAIIQTWKDVHVLLDELGQQSNSRGYGSIQNAGRRTALKPQLDIVTLTRIPE
jgi:CRISPR-associated protein Cmr1